MKAILVIDMPEDCWDCPLHRNSWDEDNEEIMICRGTYMESHYGEIPEWCPLKPMPSSLDWKSINETITDNFEYGRCCGRQELIDEILGEEE